MTRLTPLAFALLFTGCKVVDAPKTLEAMMVYGFENVDSEPEIQTVADELPSLVKRNLEAIEEGYRVNSLRPKNLRTVGVDPGDVEEIVGALGRIEYINDLPDVLDAISHQHKDWVVDNTTFYEVLEETDRACFLKKDCATYSMTAEQVTKQPVIGNLTQTLSQDFIWVEHNGQDAIASRVLAPDPVDVSSGIVAVDQQYAFYLVRQLPGGGCERTEAIWAEARVLGAGLPDSVMLDQAINGMSKQAEKIDAWIDGGKKKVE